MFRFRRNKSELIVLTGAIYAFVAYLTAFTLEVLFIIDLTRRSNEILSAASTTKSYTTTTTSSSSSSSSPLASSSLSLSSSTAPTYRDSDTGLEASNSAGGSQLTSIDDELFLRNTGLDRFKFESIQAHITISCLAISILYFIIFITSLCLIVALILRSTFMLLIWMCAMITMYLPEFCLVAYVSIYCWGPETRNGQTEIVFYLFRAVLNAIFIFRAHKLYKQLNYEKNFFRLKSGGRTSVSSQFAGYDSPYFVGDSLTTTINPVFNSSTLNLNRYDYIRDHHHQGLYGAGSSRGQSPTTNNSMFDSELNDHQADLSTHSNTNNNASLFSSSSATGGAGSRLSRPYLSHTGAGELLSRGHHQRPNSRDIAQGGAKLRANQHESRPGRQQNYSKNLDQPPASSKQLGKFYLGEMVANKQRTSRGVAPSEDTFYSAHHQHHNTSKHQQNHNSSPLAINDELAECELDIDYRTLGRPSTRHNDSRDVECRHHQRRSMYSYDQDSGHEDDRDHAHHDNHHHRTKQSTHYNVSLSRSQENLPSYSTQSLDRRNLREFALTEQVILRPLGHQPFEYLNRPGSTSNLNDYVATNPSIDDFRHNRRDHYSRH